MILTMAKQRSRLTRRMVDLSWSTSTTVMEIPTALPGVTNTSQPLPRRLSSPLSSFSQWSKKQTISSKLTFSFTTISPLLQSTSMIPTLRASMLASWSRRSWTPQLRLRAEPGMRSTLWSVTWRSSLRWSIRSSQLWWSRLKWSSLTASAQCRFMVAVQSRH